MRKRVAILGSTGSIGTQALDVVEAASERFEVVALAAGGGQPRLIAEQAIAHGVEVVAVAQATAAQDVQLALYAEAQRRGWDAGDHRIPRLLAGPAAAAEVARTPCDVVLNGMTGAVGLLPTLAALEAGTTVALANKESLIIGGELVTKAAAPGQLVPVDSEHSALAQALRGERPEDVRRLVVTASGGPFRGRTREELTDVTPEQAAAHPTWDMGPVITVNSATLVNKGLEVIEAHLLFDVDFDRIDVVVHPGSVVHSMVEFVDGSTMLQASPPDMRLPIALGLAWPERVPGAARGCDWTEPVDWRFEPLDEDAFPAIRVARKAGQFGRTAPAVFNAANEECVDAFVAGGLDFLGIVDTVAAVVEEHLADPATHESALTVDGVLAADAWARTRARERVAAR
ncbi:MAG: 1-deoxy-D-xylulose-5-phosphate reductoisomerase [Aeromicrobium sp.]|uniref:1-deoxy-D-xylulose-5-phosphate reductoisomerase n=1 Tax=Aeromicrobium sp. TaxID=1871063 RepID=UPI0039E4E6A9